MVTTAVKTNKINPNHALTGTVEVDANFCNVAAPTFDEIYNRVCSSNSVDLKPVSLTFVEKVSAPTVEYISQEKNNTVIVRWKDKTVTVVRCSPNDTPDLYSAFCAALAKKIYGSTSAVYREIDHKNTENINRKKEEQKQKEIAERKERERINHERKIRRIAKQMRDESEAIELLNKPLEVQLTAK